MEDEAGEVETIGCEEGYKEEVGIELDGEGDGRMEAES